MRKLSIRGLTAVSAAAIAFTILLPSTAGAASTRAEYIAQLDPICSSLAGPLQTANTSYNRQIKRLHRIAKSGSDRAFVRQDKRAADSLNHLGSLHTTSTDQLEAVSPQSADAGIVQTWISDRRQVENYVWSAAGALRRFRFSRFFQQIRRANSAQQKSQADVAGFGFQTCGSLL